jgi:hypothetical protein
MDAITVEQEVEGVKISLENIFKRARKAAAEEAKWTGGAEIRDKVIESINRILERVPMHPETKEVIRQSLERFRIEANTPPTLATEKGEK